jgi:hypothetical protein
VAGGGVGWGGLGSRGMLESAVLASGIVLLRYLRGGSEELDDLRCCTARRRTGLRTMVVWERTQMYLVIESLHTCTHSAAHWAAMGADQGLVSAGRHKSGVVCCRSAGLRTPV